MPALAIIAACTIFAVTPDGCMPVDGAPVMLHKEDCPTNIPTKLQWRAATIDGETACWVREPKTPHVRLAWINGTEPKLTVDGKFYQSDAPRCHVVRCKASMPVPGGAK